MWPTSVSQGSTPCWGGPEGADDSRGCSDSARAAWVLSGTHWTGVAAVETRAKLAAAEPGASQPRPKLLRRSWGELTGGGGALNCLDQSPGIWLFVFLILFYFYWSIIALQRCVSFCCTVKWISCMYTYIPSLLHLPPTLPIPPLWVITEPWAELPVMYSRFPLAIYFTHGSVFMPNLISQFIPPSPSSPMSTRLFSMSVFLFLPCKWVHLYHFSRFHIWLFVFLLEEGFGVLTPETEVSASI